MFGLRIIFKIIKNLITPTLASLQENYKNPSPGSLSILLQATNEALTSASKLTNRWIDLSIEPKPKKNFVPSEVSEAKKVKSAAHKTFVRVSESSESSDIQKFVAKKDFTDARKAHRRVWRQHQSTLCNK